MELFDESNLADYLNALAASMDQEIIREPIDKFLNQNEQAYVSYLVNKNTIEPITFDFTSMFAEAEERSFRESETFRGYARDQATYRRQVFRYHIPFSGESTLLKMRPSNRIIWSQEVEVMLPSEVCFDIIDYHSNAAEVKKQADEIIERMTQQNGNVTNQVSAYNSHLESRARGTFQRRKEEILAQRRVQTSIGVPIRKSGEVPRTYVVPMIQKKMVIKPTSSSMPFVPEPVLDDQNFDQILDVIYDFGRNMERHPSTYEGKGEEALRDLLLMQLSPHFESATGETFNRNGKTDILIRHEKANVFVAECKFWTGKKGFADAIDQCLNYLTWRDSKAAVINFVRNKLLQPALDEVAKSVLDHKCYMGGFAQVREGLTRCVMWLPNDESRSVKLAILSFHLPHE
jgi:hypothetical protein